MTDVSHGMVSGLIWAASLGSCLIAIAAVITATLPASGRASGTAARTTRADNESPIPKTARPAPTAILGPTRPGPQPSSREIRGTPYRIPFVN
jgi:hypothetical protein